MSPSPLKKDSRIADALAAFQDTPKVCYPTALPSFRDSHNYLAY